MGRELKRVPLNFNWPIGQLWKGYVNPYESEECTKCEGTGYNEETKKIADDWFAFDNPNYIQLNDRRQYNDNAWQYHLTELEIEALVKKGRLWDFFDGTTYRYDEDTKKWYTYKDREKVICKKPIYPKPSVVNEWAKYGMGHDGVNKDICIQTRAKHLGVYGRCDKCSGSGMIWESDKVKKLSDEWENYHPPTGEGYQLWNTTTEGHPMSPVFEDLESLAEWCSENATTWGSLQNGHKVTKLEWIKMLETGMIHHKQGNAIFI